MEIKSTDPIWLILLDKFSDGVLINILTLDKITSQIVINILAERKWQTSLKFKPKKLSMSSWIRSVLEAVSAPFPPEWACKMGRTDILEFLWKTEDFPTENWSKFAAANGQVKVIQWLIKNKIAINPQTIYVANLWGQKEVADFLKKFLD